MQMNANFMVPEQSQGAVDTKTGLAPTVMDTLEVVENEGRYIFVVVGC